MFDFNDFEKLANKFEMIQVEFPQEIEKEIYKLANKLVRKVKKRTPVKYGHLRRNWFLGPLIKEGDNWYIEVFNSLEYASYVEFGHRTRLGITKNPKNYKQKGSIAYVPGVHMLKISVEELNSQLSGELQRWLNRVLGE